MKEWFKENSIILFGLLFAAFFVTGFASTFSFFGRAADVVGVVVLLVFIDRIMKHDNAQEKKIYDLESANKVLREKLDEAKEDLQYYRKQTEELEEAVQE